MNMKASMDINIHTCYGECATPPSLALVWVCIIAEQKRKKKKVGPKNTVHEHFIQF